MKLLSQLSFLALLTIIVLNTPLFIKSASANTSSLLTRTQGRILLQVESLGEAWYVDPVTKQRVYLPDGQAAYDLMRSFGLGISEANYAKLARHDYSLVQTLKGRIVLRVEAHGEAYYVHPDGSIYYLQNGDSAYSIMREHSLGISNADLGLITPYQAADTGNLSSSALQGGNLPRSFDPVALNQVWLDLVNQARIERGQAALVLDQRWVDSATDWADYLGDNSLFTHTRPQGQSLGAWVENLDYDFSVIRNGLSWESNFFGENLAQVNALDTPESLEQAVVHAMDMFMEEESYNGGHYINVVSQDWNSTGVGFYFTPRASGDYIVTMVFHFGHLSQAGQGE